uniref:Guanine nucleotide-binding protein-like 1 n=1 Tax=Globisporangium ultimum (strain ATCC 200006 / CBS 805.95 / DAOM BR144) TaxID=431595 RepID=K3WUN2_GLOUD
MERNLREAALQEKRRQELDALKEQRKERAKTSTSANFSGKQKKVQLRARKQRLATRKDETAKLEAVNDEYAEFYEDRSDGEDADVAGIVEDEMNDAVGVDSFKHEPDFFERNKDLAADVGSRLKLTVALGKNNKDAVGKELSSFFVKETKEQIQLRLMEGQLPLDMSLRTKPLLAKEIERDPLLDHPKRPKWTYSMSKKKVDDNESMMFDRWLTGIHKKYENEKLNHFEHNLEVWRELWRVTERATHIVVVTDIRNPLVHIPPSIYDYVTAELKKPMTVVLNKVDLVPSVVVELWKKYLARRFPLCKFVCFSSRSKAVFGDTDVSNRRRVLSKKLEVGDASAIRGAVEILKSCEIDAEIAQAIAEELNSNLASEQQLLDEDNFVEPEREIKGKRRAKRKQKVTTKKNGASQSKKDANGHDIYPCNHCGYNDAVVACISCASGTRPSSADALVKTEAEAVARGYLMCSRCDEEEHTELKGHHKVRLQSAVYVEETSPAELHSSNIPRVTIGLIGHPNVGKSSVLNALAGKKIVSVSHTPGHTKRLQTILIHPDICICDCPGLVFPFANVPKYLQELCGLYPFSQIREPYSAIRFLAENVALDKVLDLKPRAQLFDGIEEELEWTPWTICEAYAEKRGYRTDRRGRPDHQRAGAELIRDTVDGIIPLFFLPPNYTGKDGSLKTIKAFQQSQEAEEEHKDNENGDDQERSDAFDAEDESEESDEESEAVVETAKGYKDGKKQQGPVNAFSLLDSDSSDDDDSDSD